MLPNVVIGLDASTTACKAIAWDSHGRRLADGRSGLEMITPAPDFYEQSAETWWEATCKALREVAGQVPAERLAGLAIAHQRETFVLVDESGSPLHNAILWLDERSRPYLDSLGSQLGLSAFHQRTGKPFSGNLAVGKIAWLRDHQPQVLADAKHFLDTHAFLIHHLTGSWATSTASADALGLFDMQMGRWDSATTEVLGLDPGIFPQATIPGGWIGEISPRAAAQTGLPTGLPVFSGLGDGQAAALGCGIVQAGSTSLSLGTSVISGTFAPAYVTDPAFRTMTGGPPGSFILETVLLGGAYTVQWYLEEFLGSRFDADELERKAGELPPGAQGLMLVPYWNTAMGPYWDAHASGIMVGWRGIHRPEHFYRAILEGIGFELRLQLGEVERALRSPIHRLYASGGGTRSSIWLQILADLLGIPIERSSAQEAASLGAAVLAAAGAGLHADVAGAAYAMRQPEGEVFSPKPETYLTYTKLFDEVYRPLYPSLRPVFQNLTGITTDI